MSGLASCSTQSLAYGRGRQHTRGRVGSIKSLARWTTFRLVRSSAFRTISKSYMELSGRAASRRMNASSPRCLRRFAPLPILPRSYDHLDSFTIQSIHKRFPKIRYFVPLGKLRDVWTEVAKSESPPCASQRLEADSNLAQATSNGSSIAAFRLSKYTSSTGGTKPTCSRRGWAYRMPHSMKSTLAPRQSGSSACPPSITRVSNTSFKIAPNVFPSAD
jgi:hypothetical protein